ncbi:hypothetical protein [Georgenia sp. MJ170]|uniref:hypothetical protein n=1 Tax=Georgenia sunbinii TaxID=3117728 RepID=UPI002F266857
MAIGTRAELDELGTAYLERASLTLTRRARELRLSGAFKRADLHEAWAGVCAAELARREAWLADGPMDRVGVLA